LNSPSALNSRISILCVVALSTPTPHCESGPFCSPLPPPLSLASALPHLSSSKAPSYLIPLSVPPSVPPSIHPSLSPSLSPCLFLSVCLCTSLGPSVFPFSPDSFAHYRSLALPHSPPSPPLRSPLPPLRCRHSRPQSTTFCGVRRPYLCDVWRVSTGGGSRGVDPLSPSRESESTISLWRVACVDLRIVSHEVACVDLRVVPHQVACVDLRVVPHKVACVDHISLACVDRVFAACSRLRSHNRSPPATIIGTPCRYDES
jgi:hypothetical protein